MELFTLIVGTLWALFVGAVRLIAACFWLLVIVIIVIAALKIIGM